MAALTLISTMPTHCALHKHTHTHTHSLSLSPCVCVCVCDMCVHQRENTLLIYTGGCRHQYPSIRVWRPWRPWQCTVQGTHTYSHRPLHTFKLTWWERERERARERARERERESARERERGLSFLFRLTTPVTSTLLDGSLSPAGPCHPPQARTPISGWRRESWECEHLCCENVQLGRRKEVCINMSILYMCKYLTTLRWQQQSEDGWGALCANSPLI